MGYLMARPKEGTTFWDRVHEQSVVQNNGCYEFYGSTDECGYGRIQLGSGDKNLVRIHRQAWIEKNGPLADGLCVCHKCDNPKCWNIEHLFCGTHEQNMKDRQKKGRYNQRGSTAPSAKLNEEKVKIIKEKLISGQTCYSLGREYDVTGETILAIRHGRTWSHVQ